MIGNLNRGIAVNYEQLAGENSCADSVTQARYPRDNYLQMKEMAIKAVRMQEAGPASSESSATVLQGPKESCTNFIDRLQNILQHEEAQRLLLKELAKKMPIKSETGNFHNRNPNMCQMVITQNSQQTVTLRLSSGMQQSAFLLL